jgi:hypothetical protein
VASTEPTELAGLVEQAAANDQDVQATIDEIATHPDEPTRVAALTQLLSVLAARDSATRAALTRLAGQATSDPAVGGVAITLADQAQVGKVVTIGQAGTGRCCIERSPRPMLSTPALGCHRSYARSTRSSGSSPLGGPL